MPTIRVASFNVSMEASNYRRSAKAPLNPSALKQRLQNGKQQQICNIAEIIQRVRPDVILLNEFDYIDDTRDGIEAFNCNYLQQPQAGAESISYPYFYVAPVNSGVPSPYDIDGDGVVSGTGNDAYGFGFYPGQYGMALLSRYPINTEQIRTFQKLLWHTMPNHQKIVTPTGEPFYDNATFDGLRLSSKSHWDIPIAVDGKTIHLLAAHPTPPVFDGPERRNAARNFDEIRLWADYISAHGNEYIVDDGGVRGGLGSSTPFVIVGDYNASPIDGDSLPNAIEQLLNHPLVNSNRTPSSIGAAEHSPSLAHAYSHTASWRARVDYVLPARAGIELKQTGVFWPSQQEALHRLVESRASSSDHRLVWADLKLV